MRFMALSKGNQQTETFVPTIEAVAQMETYIRDAMRAGWLIATEGLHPSAKAARITVAGGKRTVTDGPFTESKELIASYALLEVGSKEEAIERCQAFLDLIGGGEVELWQVYTEADFA
jgi:hypothetical protein